MEENIKSKIEVSVGLSRKWDSHEAGREVAETAIKKLNKPPSFVLLFSTIHYKNHGGFKELLNGVWKVLPKGTPLIGGTVAGFINNHGCFSRGVTAIAVSYTNLDAAVGIGKYTKTDPERAGRNCSEMIKSKLKNSKFKNKFVIDMVSAPTIPKVPGFDRVNVVKSNFAGWFATHLLTRACGFFGTGLAREVDVIDELDPKINEYNIIGGSSVDSGDMLYNYQFIGNEIHTNSIVALGCNIDLPIFLKGKIGVHQTNKTFKITGSACNDYIITEINNDSAKMEFFKLLDFPVEQFKELEQFYYKTADYFPITFEENNERVIGVAGIFGDNLVVSHKLAGKHAKLLTVTGEEVLNNISTMMEEKKDFPFLLGFSSAIYLFMLGRKSFDIKDILDEKMAETPYLMLFPMVENIRIVGNKPSVRVYSTNIFSLGNGISENIKAGELSRCMM